MKKQTLLVLLFVVFSMNASKALAAYSRVGAPLGSMENYTPLPISNKPRKRLFSKKIVVKNTSSPSFIRFRCVNMNFRSYGDLKKVKTVLGPNSVVQLPNFPRLGIQVHEYNEDGSLDFYKTIENWLEMSKYRNSKSKLNSPHLMPKTLNGELYLPVKVIQASDSRFNPNSRDAYGYLALDFLRKGVNPRCYEATTMMSREMLSDGKIIGGRPVSGGGFSGGHSETTGTDGIDENIGRVETSDLFQSRIFNCDNTRYRQNGYSRHSCLKDLSLEEKAKLVMRDVSEINKLRPEFKIDPRFSLCIAYRESGIAPNAQGSHSDSGIYQVTDSTARGVLRRQRPVIPHFGRLRQNQYKAAMLKSTLAQADLHHMVLFEKAKHTKLLKGINRNPENVGLLQTLATRYNGAGSRARRYGRKVANCYKAMQQVASVDGEIHNPSGLKRALRRARG